MSSKPDSKTLMKAFAKSLFFAGIAGGLLYALLSLADGPDQDDVIDTNITYTTTYNATIDADVTPTVQEVVGSISQYVDVPEGGIDWKMLAETKSIPYSFINEEEREIQGVKPKFSDALKVLDGKNILIQGYIFPLDANEEQSRFLFGPFPVGCPYHYHVGPALVIEVHAKNPIRYSWDAMNISGRLELVERDDNYNVFYRLHDAVIQ